MCYLADVSFDAAFIIPPWLLSEWLETPLWIWFAIPLALLASWLVAWLVGWVACRIIGRREQEPSRFARLVNTFRAPVQMVVGIGLFRVARTPLPLPGGLASALSYMELAGATAAAVWLLLRIISFASDQLGSILLRSGKAHAIAVIPLLRKVMKSAAVLLGAIFLLQNAGMDVGALLAGLGIGGLALALAGQKTVENLFGGIALAMDQPARVGEFCKFDGSSGTIEDIGLRSTRVRTPEKTLVTIPNSKLSEMLIENFASRGRILLNTTISLDLRTSLEQVQAVLEGIRAIFSADASLIEDGGRVRLSGINTTSLEVELFGYMQTTDVNRFFGVREEILIQVLRVLETHGVELASVVPVIRNEAALDGARDG